MTRLFVSGCSYTDYWPILTWPWFLSPEFDETYNYAKSGAGNEYIFHSIIQADTDHHFTPNDIIIIVWSGFFRFDYILQDPNSQACFWKTTGDWTRWGDDHPRQLIPYLNEDGYIKKSLNYMLTLSRYLKAKNIPYVYSSIYDMRIGEPNILNELYDENFVMPMGLDFYKLKHYESSDYVKNYPPFGGHPNYHIQQSYALEFAKKLNLNISYDEYWTNLDKLVLSETNVRNKSKEHNFQISCEGFSRVSQRIPHCLLPDYQIYYKNSLVKYKKIIGNAFKPKA